MKDISFVNIIEVDNLLKEKVRQWRNKDIVKRYMLTQHYITKGEHNKWLKILKDNDNKNRTWISFFEKEPIGIVSLNNIDLFQKKAEWGFYIGEEKYIGQGLGGKILSLFLKMSFEELGIKKLTTKVLDENKRALNIYTRLGFKKCENEYMRINNKNKKVYTYEITIDDLQPYNNSKTYK